ncbi:MAG TPA: polysaccharide deacetylase family protein [Gemmatimonadaceae bacterium]|nr:polysaccharide deacetylase family protein [Gemmatimonadaceae bacterium]
MRRTARQSAKRIVERALVAGGVAYVGRAVRRHGAAVLAYHNVVPDDVIPAGDRSLHLTRSDFVRQLQHLRASFDVVPLGELLHEPTRPFGRPRVAITFDDAYHGALTLGVDELRRLGLPATVFVAPALLGERAFWWDVVADPALGEVHPSLRERVLTELGGRGMDVPGATADLDSATLTPCHRPGTVSDVVEALERHPALTLGAHSWSHPNLAAVTDAELAKELDLPLEWLARTTDRWLPIIAYPYGLTSPRVAKAATDRGYLAGWRAAGGWMRPASRDMLDCPRVTIPAGVSSDGFALLVAGLR